MTYEDSDGQSQTKEFPVKFTAQEAAKPDINDGMTPDDGQNQQGVPHGWALVALAVIMAIVLTVVLVRRHRKKAKKHDIDEDWDDWASGDPAGSAAADEAPTQTIAHPTASADSAKGQA